VAACVKGDTHLGSCTVGATKTMNWNPGGESDTQFFKHGDLPKKHLLLAVQSGAFDVSTEALPWAGMSGFATVTQGSFICIVIEPSFVAANCGGDVALWLANQPSDALLKCPAFWIEEGESCWMPFGSFPCFISVASKTELTNAGRAKGPKKPETKQSFGGMLISLCPNMNDANADLVSIQQTAAAVTRGLTYMAPSVRSGKGFVEWRAALDAKQTETIETKDVP
jgi:hypothetical protein